MRLLPAKRLFRERLRGEKRIMCSAARPGSCSKETNMPNSTDAARFVQESIKVHQDKGRPKPVALQSIEIFANGLNRNSRLSFEEIRRMAETQDLAGEQILYCPL